MKRIWMYSISLLLMATACSTKKDIKPDELSAAAPIALEEKSDLANTDDATIFSDLDPAKAADISKNLEADETAGLATKPSDTQETASSSDAKPFYGPIGGESLGRVAYTLYGSKKRKQQLIEQNPDLKGSASLLASQKVYFSFDSLDPRPMYLTKGLLDSYPGELAEHIDSHAKLEKGSATLQNGETLQKLSQRLYGTTRYWTEIYLLNHDKLAAGYDHVTSGTELSIIKRDSIPAAAIASVEKLPADEVSVPSPQEPIVEKQAAAPPVIAPSPPTTQAVVIPPPAQPSPPPPPVVNSPLPQMNTQAQDSIPAQIDKASGDDQAALIRRGIYVALIVSIAAIAFYLTRPSKKKNFDMLDVTTQQAASGKRPKLVDQDDDSKFVG